MNQQGTTLDEIIVAFHLAKRKMERNMQRNGNEDGRYDEKYLALLVVEELKMNRFSHTLQLVSGTGNGEI